MKSTNLLLLVATLALVCGCTKSPTTSTDASNLNQNAIDAEKAEEQMATMTKKPAPKTAKRVRKGARSTASVGANDASSQFVVQIGAFHDKANADRLEASLKTQGYPVVERQLDHSKNGHLFLVHLEPFAKRTDAETWSSKLKASNINSQLIVHSSAE